MNQFASESTLFLGMGNEVLDQRLFLSARYQCESAFMSKLTRHTEPTLFNVMAAFAMKIVCHGWIFSGISSKSENFLQTGPWFQAVDLHRLWARMVVLGSGSENLWNQTKHTALFTELSCAMQTEELLFSQALLILKRTNRHLHTAQSSDATLP